MYCSKNSELKITLYLKYFKFSYFLIKIYVMGSQENRFNEKFLLNTQIVCLKGWVLK